MFLSQLKKELLTLRGEVLFAIGAILPWTVFLHTRIADWDPLVVLLLGWLPAVFFPLWIVLASVQLYRQEWSANTHYLMLSLPTRAWRISLAKLTAILIAALAYLAVVTLSGLTLFGRIGEVLPELHLMLRALPAGWLATTVAQVVVGAFFWSLLLAVVTQFSYLFSRLFERFQWLLMAWTWILSFWVMDKFVHIAAPLFGWLPDLRVGIPRIIDQEFIVTTAVIDGGPLWATLLFGVLMACLVNVVIEQAVEA